jgi:molybdenum cofactor cytidylyltransferase
MPPSETTDRNGPVAGILLAAGTSSRMGSNKLLFELDGESVLRRAARRALAGGLAPLLVVLGHQEDKARRELAGLECRMVVNPDYETGMGSSLKAGIAAVPPDAQAALVLLADMPFVTPEMIAALVARYRASRAPLVISLYGGKAEGAVAPPMLYDRALFAEILAMPGGRCGKQVVKRHRHESEILDWPASALSDIDVPDDYARVNAGRDAGKE